MTFVTIEKNQASVPSDENIKKAMTMSFGTVTAVSGPPAGRRVDFTGTVNHNTFENNLIEVAQGKRNSWNFAWGDSSVSVHGLGATQYEIDIKMSPDTVTKLDDGKYSLYAFKAVQATQSGGAPLVWFQLNSYSTETNLVWSVQYQAYTSTNTIVSNGEVSASFSVDIDLGQVLNVQEGGIGDVTTNGTAQAISVYNKTDGQFTCGIAQLAADGQTNPLCAFPLYGNQLDVIAPIEKVLLMFSTEAVNTGTVIEQTYSVGVLIDLTSANRRSVSYDINKGWSWGGFSWGLQVPPNQLLAPLLIESAASSAGAAVEVHSLARG